MHEPGTAAPTTEPGPTAAESPAEQPSVPTAEQAAFLAAVADRLPRMRLLTDPGDRESYRHDETPYLRTGLPLAVALPTDTAQVAALMKLATAHRVPVVPRGAGTGLSGGAAG